VTLTLTSPITILSLSPTADEVSEPDASSQEFCPTQSIQHEEFDTFSDDCSSDGLHEPSLSNKTSNATAHPKSLMHGPSLDDYSPSGDSRPMARLGFHDAEGHAIDCFSEDISDKASGSSSDSEGGYAPALPAKERFPLETSDEESDKNVKILKPALKRFSIYSDSDNASDTTGQATGSGARQVRFAQGPEVHTYERVQSLIPVTHRFSLETDSDEQPVLEPELYETESDNDFSDSDNDTLNGDDDEDSPQSLIPVQERFDMRSAFEPSEGGSDGEESEDAEEEYSGPEELTAAVVRQPLESDSESDGEEESADNPDSESQPQERKPAVRRMSLGPTDDGTNHDESPSPKDLKAPEVRPNLGSNESRVAEEPPGDVTPESDLTAAIQRLTRRQRDEDTHVEDEKELYKPSDSKSAFSDDSSSKPFPYLPHSEEGIACLQTIKNFLSMDPDKPAAEVQAVLSRNPSIIRHMSSRTIPHPDWRIHGWGMAFHGDARIKEIRTCYDAISRLYWDEEKLRYILDAFDGIADEMAFDICADAFCKCRRTSSIARLNQKFTEIDPLWFRTLAEERKLAKTDPDWRLRLQKEKALHKRTKHEDFGQMLGDVKCFTVRRRYETTELKKTLKEERNVIKSKREQRGCSLLSHEVLFSEA
jgi:hypothetical protein